MRTIFGKYLLTAGLLFSISMNISCRDNKSNSKPSPQLQTAQDLTIDNEKLNSTIGILRAGEGACTAYISGESELTTAYHCLEKTPGVPFDIREIEFTLADGTKPALMAITLLAPRKDLGRIQLKDKAKFHLESSVKTQHSFTLAAYDLDTRTLDIETGCKWNQDINPAGVFAYDCVTKGHYSGAPIFEGDKVIGIHLGYKPKVDRRVALDFASLDDEQKDVLEVEYLKEGCHMRTELGLFTHTRIHVRGCDPISMIGEITQGRKEEAKNEYDSISAQVREIEQNTAAKVDLLQRADSAYNAFIPCIDQAKSNKDAVKADNCFAAFKDEMNLIVGQLARQLQNDGEAKWDILKTEAQKHLVSDSHRISQDIVNKWNRYIDCSTDALKQEQPIQRNAALKGCNTTMILDFKSISNDIASLDINILDTF